MKWVPMACIPLLLQCSIADLRTDYIKEGKAADGKHLYQQIAEANGLVEWQRYPYLSLSGTNHWKSWTMRKLTPVENATQDFTSTLGIGRGEHRLKFIPGKIGNDVIGIDSQNRTWRADGEGKKVFKDERAIRIYLRPMQNYIEWPFTLRNSATVLNAGETILNGRTTDRLFVTDGKPEPEADRDQFIVYADRETKEIRRIDLTVRDLMKTATATIIYDDFRMVQGVRLAHKITIFEKPEDENYLQEYRIKEYKFLKDAPAGF